jgi:hypothetical protein
VRRHRYDTVTVRDKASHPAAGAPGHSATMRGPLDAISTETGVTGHLIERRFVAWDLGAVTLWVGAATGSAGPRIFHVPRNA